MFLHTIFGAPGCGKTHRLMEIMESELMQCPPEKMAFVTFTRQGVEEATGRIKEKFNLSKNQLQYCRTIHSLAHRATNDEGKKFMLGWHYRNFSDITGFKFLGYYTEDLISNDDKYLHIHSVMRNICDEEEPAFLFKDINYSNYLFIKESYEKYKNEKNLRDFDDCIIDFINRNSPLPVDVAFIDEAQDLTPLQWKFCEVAFSTCKKLYIAGDDDQALYEWRGANVKLFLKWASASDKIDILDKSYRLNETVLMYSKKIIDLIQIKNRVDKKFFPVNQGGGIFFIKYMREIKVNRGESYYFLSRNNLFLKKFKEFLEDAGAVYQYKKNSKFVSSVEKALYRSIELYNYYRKSEPARIKEDKRVFLRLKKEIQKNIDTIEEFPNWERVYDINDDQAQYYNRLLKKGTEIEKCNCIVSTIHGVKGGEADNVVLLLDITKNVSNALDYNVSFESEVRCLYVALTRAKKNVYIIYSQDRSGMEIILNNL